MQTSWTAAHPPEIKARDRAAAGGTGADSHESSSNESGMRDKQDTEFKRSGDEQSVWRSTSRWRVIQMEILKANFVNIDEMFNAAQPLSYSPFLEWIELRNVDNILRPPDDLASNQRPFLNRLVQLQRFTDEPPVDQVARDLLTFSGFESELLHFRSRPHLEIEWRSYKISSEADFGVYSDRPGFGPYAEYVVVVENKPEAGPSLTKSECQLFGEMFVAAMVRHQMAKMNVQMYGILLSGPYVRFYHANFSDVYLRDIESERSPSISVTVERYPSDTVRGLSLIVKQERLEVVRTLLMIRHLVEATVSQ